MNKFDEMRQAVNEARHTMHAADSVADQMASMIAGRLRVASVSGSTLTALKRELRDWDMHRGCWKDK